MSRIYSNFSQHRNEHFMTCGAGSVRTTLNLSIFVFSNFQSFYFDEDWCRPWPKCATWIASSGSTCTASICIRFWWVVGTFVSKVYIYVVAIFTALINVYPEIKFYLLCKFPPNKKKFRKFACDLNILNLGAWISDHIEHSRLIDNLSFTLPQLVTVTCPPELSFYHQSISHNSVPLKDEEMPEWDNRPMFLQANPLMMLTR